MIDYNKIDNLAKELAKSTINIIESESHKAVIEFQIMLNKNAQEHTSVFAQCVRLITIKVACQNILDTLQLTDHEKELNRIVENIISKSLSSVTILKEDKK